MEYNIIADLHTHTTLSMHAYSTVNENIEVASSRNLKYLATTDHYYKFGERGTHLYDAEVQGIWGFRRISRTEDRINHIAGVELNVCRDKDYSRKLERLPWRIASCHPDHIQDKTLDEIKEDIKYLIENNKVDAIGHPDKFLNSKFEGDNYKEFYDWLTDICKEHDVSLEVNNSSCSYLDAVDYVKYWLNIAKEKGNKIHLGTDAHYCKEIGIFDSAIKVLKEVDYPEHLIINCNEEELAKIYKRQKDLENGR